MNMWIVIWFISLICLFEAEIRSIGLSERVEQISLLPHFWLSDLGLIIPIIFVILPGRIGSMLKHRFVHYYLIFFCLYGFILFLLRGNPISLIGFDIRMCIAFVTGLSLIAILPKRHLTIGFAISVVSAAAVLLSFYSLVMFPDINIIGTNERISTSYSFIFLSVPLVLIGPSLIYSFFTKNRILILLLWLTAVVLLMESILILQTRSLVIALLSMFVFVFVAGYRMHSWVRNRYKFVMGTVCLCVLVVLVPIYYNWGAFGSFLARLSGTGGDDVSTLYRIYEVSSVFEAMNFWDHLFGMGFGVISPSVDMQGDVYSSLHIGILNIWWRFGLVGTVFWFSFFCGAFAAWIKALGFFHKKNVIRGEVGRRFAVIMCAPGLFTLVVVSMFSGGWSPNNFIALGMLLGVFYSFAYHNMNPHREQASCNTSSKKDA
jgi:hypothetical protein